MNKENASKLWTLIQEAGLYLLGHFYLTSSYHHNATKSDFNLAKTIKNFIKKI